jgi:hypothetical protein
VENSDGIDPDYCCRVAVVRWRRILGAAARPLVKITVIDFPNHSRSYDVTSPGTPFGSGDMTARSRHRSSSTRMRWHESSQGFGPMNQAS